MKLSFFVIFILFSEITNCGNNTDVHSLDFSLFLFSDQFVFQFELLYPTIELIYCRYMDIYEQEQNHHTFRYGFLHPSLILGTCIAKLIFSILFLTNYRIYIKYVFVKRENHFLFLPIDISVVNSTFYDLLSGVVLIFIIEDNTILNLTVYLQFVVDFFGVFSVFVCLK